MKHVLFASLLALLSACAEEPTFDLLPTPPPEGGHAERPSCESPGRTFVPITSLCGGESEEWFWNGERCVPGGPVCFVPPAGATILASREECEVAYAHCQ